jgi:hypothetical protein
MRGLIIVQNSYMKWTGSTSAWISSPCPFSSRSFSARKWRGPSESREGRFGGADHVRLSAGDGRGQLPGALPDFRDSSFPFRLFRAGEVETDQAGERRIAEFPAKGKLIRVKTGIVVFLRSADGVMAGVEGLDDHTPRLISPPSPTRYLRQDLEGPLGRSEVRDVQGGVGDKNADQCDPGEIVPLGNHLGADENVDLSAVEPSKDPCRISPPRGRVTVHPCDPGIRKEFFRLFFNPFCSRPLAADMNATARGADAGRFCREVTVMAF